MFQINKNKLFTLFGMALWSTAACASTGGGIQGGGGSWYYLTDEMPKLADPFTVPVGVSMRPSDEVFKFMDAISEFLRTYGVVSPKDSGNFWNSFIKSRKAEYRWVKTPKDLPCQDTMEVNLEGIASPEYHLAQYACTRGNITFVAQSEFEGKPFELQAFALLHERLHAFAPDADHGTICPFTTALMTLIDLGKAQAEGKRAELTDSQIRAVTEGLYTKGEQLGFKLTVAPDDAPLSITILPGGGLKPVYSDVIIEDSLIGVGSRLADRVTGKIQGSTLLKTSVSGKVDLINIQASDCSFVDTAAIDYECKKSRTASSRIRASRTEGSSVQYSTVDSSVAVVSQISSTTLEQTSVVNSHLVRIQARKNSEITGAGLAQMIIESGVRVENLDFRFNGNAEKKTLVLSPKGQHLSFPNRISCVIQIGWEPLRVNSWRLTNQKIFSDDEQEFAKAYCN